MPKIPTPMSVPNHQTTVLVTGKVFNLTLVMEMHNLLQVMVVLPLQLAMVLLDFLRDMAVPHLPLSLEAAQAPHLP